MSKKLFVIGLDCADPVLVFDRWADELPNLKKLMEAGTYGELESTVPPITVPAWTCMLTGKDPGELGFYGFRNRANYSYDQMSIATSTAVKFPRVWEWASAAGKRVIVIGVPQTYPPRPVNGLLVTSFLTPSTFSDYTYPKEFKAEIARVVGDYMLDVRDFRTEDKGYLLQQIYEMTEKRCKLVKHLLRTRAGQWDFFMWVEMGPDRIHHGLWKYTDPRHPKYEPGNPYESSIRDYYRYLDREIGEMLALLPEDAAVLVMSDHGAQPLMGGICINEWLMREGYLTLADEEYMPGNRRKIVTDELCDVQKPQAGQPIPLEKVEIDWTKTRAWAAGGYYGRLFLNVQGREPKGVIPADQYEATRDELIEKLEGMIGLDGKPLGTRVVRPEDVYREINNIPPDLIIYFGNLAWRSVGSVGLGRIYTFENDTGPDDANHAQQGMFILVEPGKRGGGRVQRTWRAVAPTMLELIGLPMTAYMDDERLG